MAGLFPAHQRSDTDLDLLTNPDLFLGVDQHVDRVTVGNTCYASVDSYMLQAKSVCDRRGQTLAKYAESTGKNEQGDESGKQGTASSKVV